MVIATTSTFAQFGYGGFGYGWGGGTYVNYPIGSAPATTTTDGSSTTPITVEIKNYIKRTLQILGWVNSGNGGNEGNGSVTTEDGLVLPGSLPDTGAGK